MPYRALRRGLEALFDRHLGIDTSRLASLGDLGLSEADRLDYEPSGWLDLRRILRWIEPGPADVFLDLGCGKGRVILLAARHPFRRVIGVEVSEDLSTAARRNLAAYGTRLRSAKVEVITADVRDYRIPDDVSVVYIFNAFRGQTFDTVVANLIESVDRHPRSVRLIYLNAREHDRLIHTGRFRLIRAVSRRRPFHPHADQTYLRVYVLEPVTSTDNRPERCPSTRPPSTSAPTALTQSVGTAPGVGCAGRTWLRQWRA